MRRCKHTVDIENGLTDRERNPKVRVLGHVSGLCFEVMVNGTLHLVKYTKNKRVYEFEKAHEVGTVTRVSQARDASRQIARRDYRKFLEGRNNA